MKSRKILFLIPEFPHLGGTEKSSAMLGSLLAGRGNEVYIFARRGDMSVEDFGLDPRIHLQLEDGEVSADRLSEFITVNGIEVVINACMICEGINRVVEQLRSKVKVPVISVLHYSPIMTPRKSLAENTGSIIKRGLKFLGWPVYERLAYRKYLHTMQRGGRVSDAVVVLCPDYIGKVHNILGTTGLPARGVVSIPNSVTPSALGDAEGIRREKRIVYCGRLWEHTKRVSRVLQIWQRTAPLFPDWQLDLVGDGPDMERYRRYVEKRKLRRVNFIGYTANPREYMKRGSILLLTSDREGMVLVVPEAQAEGCVPVIYNSFDSAKYMINHGEDGLLIPPFDEDEFIRGLHQLMQSPQELERMSRNAVENIVKFSPSVILDKWESLFDSLTETL